MKVIVSLAMDINYPADKPRSFEVGTTRKGSLG